MTYNHTNHKYPSPDFPYIEICYENKFEPFSLKTRDYYYKYIHMRFPEYDDLPLKKHVELIKETMIGFESDKQCPLGKMSGYIIIIYEQFTENVTL